MKTKKVPVFPAIFQEGDIQITERQAVFGKEIFLISEITSVVVMKVGPKPRGGITLLFLVLLAAAFLAANAGLISMNVPLVLTFLFIIWAVVIQLDESFTLSLVTEEKAAQVFTSRNEGAVQEIVDALNIALAQAGNKKVTQHTGVKYR
jgi:hypothetical protein